MKSRFLGIAVLIALAAILLTSLAVYRHSRQSMAEPEKTETQLALEEGASAQSPPAPESESPEDPTTTEDAAFEPENVEPVKPPVEAAKTDAPPPSAAPRTSQPPQALSGPFGLRITGTVHDAQGRPIENAQLRWLPLDFYSSASSVSFNSILADGDASQLPPGSLRDALLGSRVTQPDPEGNYIFEFERPAHPRGAVVAAAPGYEIQMRKVEVRFDGSRSIEEAIREGLEAVIDFRLGFAGVISGTVRDRESGAGVAGMAVAAQRHEPGASPMRVLTEMSPAAPSDAEGRFIIEGLAAGEYWVAPKTGESDYVSITFREGRKVRLEAGSEAVEVDFEVDLGGRISGRFVDLDGKPVPQVSCSAVPSNMNALLVSGNLEYMQQIGRTQVKTPADGSFEFRGLEIGLGYRISGKAVELADLVSDPVQLTPESPQAELELVMSRGSTISGSVLDEDGRPASRVQVLALLANNNPLDYLSRGSPGHAFSDADGGFELRNLTAGKYRLMAGEPRHFAALMNVRQDEEEAPYVTVEVDGKTDLSGIVLSLDDSDETLSGIIVDDRGQPIAEASVTATASFPQPSHSSAVSQEDGSFELHTTAKGPFRVVAQTKYSQITMSGVEAGSQNLHIVLDRPGSISGRVILSDESSLPADSKIEVRMSARGDRPTTVGDFFSRSSGSAVPASDGTFRIEAPSGQSEVIARIPGFAPANSGPVSVRPGEETGNVEILLTQGAVLAGTVVRPNGTPVEGAKVRAALDEGDFASQLSQTGPYGWMRSRNVTTTDSQGEFVLPNLSAGTYLASARDVNQTPSEGLQIELLDGQTQHVRLEIPFGGTISGIIVDGDQPRPGLAVMASTAGLLTQMTISDEEGNFLLQGLPGGECGLHVSQLGGTQQYILKSLQVTVRPQEVERVEIDLATGQSLFGNIQGGSPDGLYQVLVRRAGTPSPQNLSPVEFFQALMLTAGIRTPSPSDYEVRGIDPGRYLLEVYRLPEDPSNPASYQNLDRRPLYQQEVEVGEADLTVDIVLR